MDHDSLSSILGWISIACWIVVFSPQIYENYELQSGEGLSVLFVAVWLLGDVTNVAGAILGGLLPTVIILGLYYLLCDLILFSQIYYYRWKRNKQVSGNNEHQPLLTNHREPVANLSLFLRYTIALFFVFFAGAFVWWVRGKPDTARGGGSAQEPRLEVLVLGWSSASLYLGARLPQIFKNFKTRCEGLSPALFFFAIFGNVTYALSICAKSIDRTYLITNAGWLAGSALTVFLDVFVLCQVFYYRTIDGPSRSYL